MARSLGSEFLAQCNAASSRPYLVLQIDWSITADIDVTRYYLDRDANDFATGDGDRVGVGAINRVLDWGELRIELNEGGIGGADEVQVVLSDEDKIIKKLLELQPQQRRSAFLWRMFDDATVTWSNHKELIFSGALMPYQWTEGDQTVTLTLANMAKRVTKSVGKVADRAVFARVPPEYEDHPLPIIWGKPRRVPAIPVQYPWASQIIEDAPPQQIPLAGDVTLDILHHPDDMGVSTGVVEEAFLGTDRVSGTFAQSSDKLNTPSTFTITAQDDASVCVGPFQWHAGAGSFTSNDILVLRADLIPPFYSVAQWFAIDPDKECYVWDAGSGTYTTMTVTAVAEPGGYSNAWVKISVNQDVSNLSGTLALLDKSNVRRHWPAGTVLQARGAAAEIKYIFSMLPAGSVARVEGYGGYEDEGGRNVQGFTVIDPSLYEVNLSDSQWAVAMGHNSGTVTFKAPPRFAIQSLAGNDIWVTCGSVEGVDAPATVAEYVQSEHLFDESASWNVSSPWVADHATDFSDAGLDTQAWAYVQREIRTGLDVLHEIARNFGGVILADQGTLSGILLRNTDPGVYVATFDETNIIERSVVIEESSVDDLISHILADWTRDWDDVDDPLRLVRFNATVRDTFRQQHQDFDMMAWRGKDEVEHILDFWLTRWTKIYRTVTFETTLRGLICQPGDWVQVSFTDADGVAVFEDQAMEVQAVGDTPGGTGRPPVITIVARYAVFTY